MILLATTIDRATENVTPKETSKLHTTRHDKGRYLLLHAIAYTGVPTKQCSIGITILGKPYLIDYPDFHFSLSYSGILVICAADTSEIGADIEQIRNINITDYREYLSTTEYYQLVALPAAEQQLRFFLLWTLKESYLKMTGAGLSGLHHRISMQFSEGRWWLWENGIRNKELYLHHYYPMPGYVAAVCSYEPAPDAITWVD